MDNPDKENYFSIYMKKKENNNKKKKSIYGKTNSINHMSHNLNFGSSILSVICLLSDIY